LDSCEWRAEYMYMDYEEKLINAANKFYPKMIQKGSLFHFFKLLMRKANKKQLLDSNYFQRTCEVIFSLALLTICDPTDIDSMFTKIAKFHSMEEYSWLYGYFYETWMSDNAKYPRGMWNIGKLVNTERKVLKKYSCALEEMHAYIKKKLGEKKEVTMKQFIEVLKEIEYDKKDLYEKGMQNKNIKKCEIKKNIKIPKSPYRFVIKFLRKKDRLLCKGFVRWVDIEKVLKISEEEILLFIGSLNDNKIDASPCVKIDEFEQINLDEPEKRRRLRFPFSLADKIDETEPRALSSSVSASTQAASIDKKKKKKNKNLFKVK